MRDLNKHPLVQLYIEHNNFGRILEMDFNIEAPGQISYSMPVTSLHLATPFAAHGGAISALMDATMGICALSKVLEEDKVVSTIELKISFVKPAFENDFLHASADVIKTGSRLIFVEGKIFNQNDELVAFGTGTFNAYPAAKAGFRP